MAAEQVLLRERGERGGRLHVPPLLRYSVLPLIVAGITSLLSAALGLLSGDYAYSERLALWGLGFVAAGAAWLAATRPSHSLTREGALVLVAASWVLVPLLSALPVVALTGLPLLDIWFESVSGFTTTGLSVFTGGVDPAYGAYLPRVEELPWSVLWWRAVTQWLGGFGVVVLFYTMARLGGLPAHLVGAAEGRFERLEPSISKSLRALMGLYLSLTAFGTFLLYVAGMGPGDALYHTMTGLATGGFSTHSASIGYYGSVVVEAAVIVVMVLGASNFADLYALLRGIPRRFSREIETMLALMVFNSLLGYVLLRAAGWDPISPLRNSVFHVISGMSGTGFGITDLSEAPSSFKLLLTVAMITGGSAFSTTGGIKMYRVMIILKSVAWSIRETVYGKARISVPRVGGYRVDDSELKRAIAVTFLFVTALLAGAFAITAIDPRVAAVDALFEAQSALCTVGLSVGITSAATAPSIKAILMALMTLGRLEVIGFLYAAVAAARLAAGKRRRTRAAPLRLARKPWEET